MCSIDSGLWCWDATTQAASEDVPFQHQGWRGVLSFSFKVGMHQGRVTLPCKSLRRVRAPNTQARRSPKLRTILHAQRILKRRTTPHPQARRISKVRTIRHPQARRSPKLRTILSAQRIPKRRTTPHPQARRISKLRTILHPQAWRIPELGMFCAWGRNIGTHRRIFLQ